MLSLSFNVCISACISLKLETENITLKSNVCALINSLFWGTFFYVTFVKKKFDVGAVS